jgi:hypothetical protein
MSFFALGMTELVFLLALGGGAASQDLVSWLDPGLYFSSRQIKLEPDAMADIAAREPKDPQTGVAQLLALRWLAENAEDARKSDKARGVVEQLAQGRGAQDRLGFAREYAARALARWEGKVVEPPALPADSLRAEGLSWFPKDAAFYAAVDLRGGAAAAGHLQLRLARFVPARELGHFYDFVDQVGNIRVDRAAFALTYDAAGNQPTKIFIRLTGRFDRQHLAAYIRAQDEGFRAKEEAGPRGEAITLITKEQMPPAFALIGDSEFLMCGPQSGRDSLPVLREVLQVRSGDKPSARAGPLAEKVKDASDRASLLVAGDVPELVRQLMARGTVPVMAPKSFTLEAGVTDKALAVRFRGSFAEAAEARSFTRTMEGFKALGLLELKAVPEERMKPAVAAHFIKVLEDFKPEADGTSVKAGVDIARAAVQAIVNWVEDNVARELQPLEDQ